MLFRQLRGVLKTVQNLVSTNKSQQILQVSASVVKQNYSSDYHYCYGEPKIEDTIVIVSELGESCVEVC